MQPNTADESAPPNIESDAADAPVKLGVRPQTTTIVALAVAAMMADPRGRLLLLAAALFMPVSLVYLLGIVVVGRCFGLRPCEFSLNFMSPLLVFRIGGCIVNLNLLPTGGSVKWSVSEARTSDSPNHTHVKFDQIHPLAQALIMVSGPMASLLLAFILLGAAAGEQFVSGFWQIAGVLFRSREENAELLASFARLIDEGRLREAAGTLAAKQAAGNLFPVLPTIGGMVLITLGEWVCRQKMSLRSTAILQYLGLAAMLTFFCCWLTAFLRLFKEWPH